MIRIQQATAEHVFSIVLRDEDAREVRPGWRARVLGNLNHTMAAVEGDEVVALFGVVPSAKEVGLWLLCSRRIERHQVFLMRQARRLVHLIRTTEDRLVYNYIPKFSHSNRRFVERLGFRILPAPGDGPDFFYLPNV